MKIAEQIRMSDKTLRYSSPTPERSDRPASDISVPEAGQLAKDCRVASLALTHYTGLDSEESMLADVRRSGYEEECWILTDGFSMGVE